MDILLTDFFLATDGFFVMISIVLFFIIYDGNLILLLLVG